MHNIIFNQKFLNFEMVVYEFSFFYHFEHTYILYSVSSSLCIVQILLSRCLLEKIPSNKSQIKKLIIILKLRLLEPAILDMVVCAPVNQNPLFV